MKRSLSNQAAFFERRLRFERGSATFLAMVRFVSSSVERIILLKVYLESSRY